MFAAIGRFIKKVGKIFTAIPKVGYGLGEIVYGVGKTATQAPVGIYLTWVKSYEQKLLNIKITLVEDILCYQKLVCCQLN